MRTSAAFFAAALVSAALTACSEGEPETNRELSLSQCLTEAGLTIARTRADVDRLEGIDGGLDGGLSTGTAGVYATSFYNDQARPPWELLVVQRPTANGDPAPRVELSAVAKRFDDYVAAAYSRPRNEAAISRGLECADAG